MKILCDPIKAHERQSRGIAKLLGLLLHVGSEMLSIVLVGKVTLARLITMNHP